MFSLIKILLNDVFFLIKIVSVFVNFLNTLKQKQCSLNFKKGQLFHIVCANEHADLMSESLENGTSII